MLGPFGPTPRLSESCLSTSMSIQPKEESVDHQAASSASSPTLPRETVLNTLGTSPPLEEQNSPQHESDDNGGIGLVVSAGSTDEESETEAHYAPNEGSQRMVQTQSPTPARTRSPHRPRMHSPLTTPGGSKYRTSPLPRQHLVSASNDLRREVTSRSVREHILSQESEDEDANRATPGPDASQGTRATSTPKQRNTPPPQVDDPRECRRFGVEAFRHSYEKSPPGTIARNIRRTTPLETKRGQEDWCTVLPGEPGFVAWEEDNRGEYEKLGILPPVPPEVRATFDPRKEWERRRGLEALTWCEAEQHPRVAGWMNLRFVGPPPPSGYTIDDIEEVMKGEPGYHDWLTIPPRGQRWSDTEVLSEDDDYMLDSDEGCPRPNEDSDLLMDRLIAEEQVKKRRRELADKNTREAWKSREAANREIARQRELERRRQLAEQERRRRMENEPSGRTFRPRSRGRARPSSYDGQASGGSHSDPIPPASNSLPINPQATNVNSLPGRSPKPSLPMTQERNSSTWERIQRLKTMEKQRKTHVEEVVAGKDDSDWFTNLQRRFANEPVQPDERNSIEGPVNSVRVVLTPPDERPPQARETVQNKFSPNDPTQHQTKARRRNPTRPQAEQTDATRPGTSHSTDWTTDTGTAAVARPTAPHNPGSQLPPERQQAAHDSTSQSVRDFQAATLDPRSITSPKYRITSPQSTLVAMSSVNDLNAPGGSAPPAQQTGQTPRPSGSQLFSRELRERLLNRTPRGTLATLAERLPTPPIQPVMQTASDQQRSASVDQHSASLHTDPGITEMRGLVDRFRTLNTVPRNQGTQDVATRTSETTQSPQVNLVPPNARPEHLLQTPLGRRQFTADVRRMWTTPQGGHPRCNDSICHDAMCPGTPNSYLGDRMQAAPGPDPGAPGTGYPCPVHRTIHQQGEVCDHFMDDGKRVRHRDMRRGLQIAQERAARGEDLNQVFQAAVESRRSRCPGNVTSGVPPSSAARGEHTLPPQGQAPGSTAQTQPARGRQLAPHQLNQQSATLPHSTQPQNAPDGHSQVASTLHCQPTARSQLVNQPNLGAGTAACSTRGPDCTLPSRQAQPSDQQWPNQQPPLKQGNSWPRQEQHSQYVQSQHLQQQLDQQRQQLEQQALQQRQNMLQALDRQQQQRQARKHSEFPCRRNQCNSGIPNQCSKILNGTLLKHDPLKAGNNNKIRLHIENRTGRQRRLCLYKHNERTEPLAPTEAHPHPAKGSGTSPSSAGRCPTSMGNSHNNTSWIAGQSDGEVSREKRISEGNKQYGPCSN